MKEFDEKVASYEIRWSILSNNFLAQSYRWKSRCRIIVMRMSLECVFFNSPPLLVLSSIVSRVPFRKEVNSFAGKDTVGRVLIVRDAFFSPQSVIGLVIQCNLPLLLLRTKMA